MPQADVTSIEAIHAFRSHFITYLVKAGLALDQAAEQVTRTRLWLQNDQRGHWEREVRQRRTALEEARAHLLSARLLNLAHSAEPAKRDFRRAERALAESEEKLSRVRHEACHYDSVMAPKLKELDRLRTFLTDDGPKATAFLTGVVAALQAYAETRAEAPRTTSQITPDSTGPGDAT